MAERPLGIAPRSAHITRVEPLPPRGQRVLVSLDEGDPFEVALEALELSRLGVGDALPADAHAQLLDLDADVRVREAAVGLLSHRVRTRQELRRKLRGKGFDFARIDACLARLEEKGLVNDAAAAAAFVRDRLRHRPRGRARLTSELRTKGIAAEVAEGTIARVFEDEDVSDSRLAKEAASAWLSRQNPSVREALAAGSSTRERESARRRLFGYLARRGFRGDSVKEAMVRAEAEARGLEIA